MADYKTPQWLLQNELDQSINPALSEDRHSLYSMDFDGSDYITAGLLSSYISLSAPTSFTVSAWIKTTDNGGTARGIVGSAQFSNGLNFYVYQGEVSFGVSSGTAVATTTTANVNDGNWHHVVGTYDSEGDASGNTLYIYVDGVQKASNTGNRGIYAFSDYPVFIGARGSQSSAYSPWVGKIDEVAIYNKVLNQSEIDALSVADAPANVMGLSFKPVAYYPLGEQAQMGSANWSFPNGSLQSHVIDFNSASSESIVLSTSASFQVQAQTVSMWVKPELNTRDPLFLNGHTAVGNVGFEVYQDYGNIRVRINGSSQIIGAVNIGEWNHVFAAYDGADLKYSVNGATIATTNFAATISYGFYTGLILGNSAYGYYDGETSNVAFWASDQSSNYVNAYNNGSPQSTYTVTPTAWWKLNAADSSYNTATSTWTFTDGPGTNDGTSTTLPSTALIPSDLQFESPYSNYSLSFDGVSDFISIPDSAELKPTTAITCSIWFKGGTQNSNRHLLSKYFDTVDGAYGFYTGSSSTDLYFYITVSGTTYDSSVVSGKLDNNWHHILGTYDGANIKVYADGALVGSVARTGLIDYNDGILCLSSLAGAPTSYEFEGLLDEAAIWNTALTANQANQIYNNGYPADLTSLSPAAWWRLGEDAYFVSNNVTIPNQITGGQTGTGSGTQTSILVGDAPGSYANGLGSSLVVTDRIGDAPESTANSVSINMIPSNRISYPAGYTPTQVDNAFSMDFDGVNDYITSNTNGISGLNNASISVWVKPTGSTSNQYKSIVNQWEPTNMAWGMWLNGTGSTYTIHWNQAGASGVNSSSIIPIDEWSHIAIVKNATTLKMFHNGSEVSSFSISAATGSGATTLNIGAQYASTTPSTFFNGKLDEVAIFNYALSERQIKQDIYEGTTTGKTADLNNISNLTAPVAWYRMGD